MPPPLSLRSQPLPDDTMPGSTLIEVERENLPGHSAVQAWGKLGLARAAPRVIETLKKGHKSAVYRMPEAGPGGSAVVAKRCLMATARAERTIYGEILPQLPLPALQLFGFVEDEDTRFGWLFLEDAGKDLYSPALAEHRAAAASWLASLHSSAANLAAAGLPDRDSNFYRRELRLARDTVTANLANPALTARERAVLRGILPAYDACESHWNRLEELCRTMPPTFVHCDLKAKNIGVRRTRAGLSLLPFDWEFAGWGTPATDLPRCGDIHLYWSEVRRQWPALKLEDVERLAGVGTIFRALIASHWKSLSLRTQWVESCVCTLAIYRDWVTAAFRALGIR